MGNTDIRRYVLNGELTCILIGTNAHRLNSEGAGRTAAPSKSDGGDS